MIVNLPVLIALTKIFWISSLRDQKNFVYGYFSRSVIKGESFTKFQFLVSYWQETLHEKVKYSIKEVLCSHLVKKSLTLSSVFSRIENDFAWHL